LFGLYKINEASYYLVLREPLVALLAVALAWWPWPWFLTLLALLG